MSSAVDLAARERATAATRRRTRLKRSVVRVAAYLAMTLGSVTMVVPFLWMLSASFKDMSDIFVIPPIWVPSNPSLEAYERLFKEVPFALYGWNSVKIAVLNTAGMVGSCALGAYGFARLRFPLKDVLFAILLATMMVPGPITLIPTFLLFTQFGWVGTHLPLIVPAFFGGAFGTFLLRQFFLTIPQDLVDAARVDGAGPLRILISLFIPLSKPALATLAVLVFVSSWNSFLGPLIYGRRQELFTLTVGLTFLVRGTGGPTWWNQVMAGAVISVMPMILIFLSAQKYFVQGIVTTGLKR